MLLSNCIEKLTGLQDIEIKKIEITDKITHIFCELQRKPHKCPHCGRTTDAIHDYRIQIIKDVPSFGNNIYIHLRKRRYRCSCGKRFYENVSFLPKYHRITNRLFAYVIEKLKNECSFTSVAREVNLSLTTVIRIFDLVSYPTPTLQKTLSIDEFKGNTGKEKYQCILTDPVNKVVLDILPKRSKSFLTSYFKKIPREQRLNVDLFVSDMWKTYYDLSGTWFKNAVRVIDKYHWIRQVIWAFENVRKEVQKQFTKTHRVYFKHSRYLLLKRFDELKDEQKQQVNIMLYASPTLSTAHYYKESFLKILHCKDRLSASKQMNKWISSALDCGIPHFVKCAKTMLNWLDGILSSFTTPVTNGFTEGCNNKIKVLKRNAYGYHNFNRFRNRILHMFSHQKSHIHKQATA